MIRNQCVVLQTPLVDGSPCGYGGHCYNASCQAGPWQDRFEEMYTQNLQISIPVTIVVGIIVSPFLIHLGVILNLQILLILFFLTRCLLRACGCCGGGRRKPKHNNRPIPPAPPMRNSQHHQYPYSQNPPPPPTRQGPDPWTAEPQQQNWNPQGPQHGGGGHGWVDESSYNGPYYGRQEAYGR